VKALQAGGADYIVKPIDLVVFKSKLAKLLGTGEDQTVSIKTRLKAEIPDFPVEIELYIIELSELFLCLESSIAFKEKSQVILKCPGLDKAIGTPLKLVGIVEKEPAADKDTGKYHIKCTFTGMHENERSSLRKLIISGNSLEED
jgi:hypothetical protein